MDPLAALGIAVDQAPPRGAGAPAAKDAGAAPEKVQFSAEFHGASSKKKEATSKGEARTDEATAADGVDQALLFLAEESSELVNSIPDSEAALTDAPEEATAVADSGDIQTVEFEAAAFAFTDARGVASTKAMTPFVFEPEWTPGARARNDTAGVLTAALASEVHIAAPKAKESAPALIEPRIIMGASGLATISEPAAKAVEASIDQAISSVAPSGIASAQNASAGAIVAPAQAAAAAMINPAHQILAAVTANRDADRIEVRLEPPELGRVRIHFSFERPDVVIATLSSERGETLDLMRRHASDLVRELERSGFGRVQLDFQSGERNDFAAPRSAVSEISELGAIDAIEDDQPLYFIRRSDKLLDRRV